MGPTEKGRKRFILGQSLSSLRRIYLCRFDKLDDMIDIVGQKYNNDLDILRRIDYGVRTDLYYNLNSSLNSNRLNKKSDTIHIDLPLEKFFKGKAKPLRSNSHIPSLFPLTLVGRQVHISNRSVDNLSLPRMLGTALHQDISDNQLDMASKHSFRSQLCSAPF